MTRLKVGKTKHPIVYSLNISTKWTLTGEIRPFYLNILYIVKIQYQVCRTRQSVCILCARLYSNLFCHPVFSLHTLASRSTIFTWHKNVFIAANSGNPVCTAVYLCDVQHIDNLQIMI